MIRCDFISILLLQMINKDLLECHIFLHTTFSLKNSCWKLECALDARNRVRAVSAAYWVKPKVKFAGINGELSNE